MAKTSLARRSAPAPRRSNTAGALKLVRAKQAMTAARARMRRDAAADSAMLMSAAAAAGLGYLEKSGNAEMLRIGGVEPTLVLGVVGGFLLPKFVHGKLGELSRQVGASSLAVAAYKFGTGQPVIAGEDDDVSGGGWESL